jgi:hypothetical protein
MCYTDNFRLVLKLTIALYAFTLIIQNSTAQTFVLEYDEKGNRIEKVRNSNFPDVQLSVSGEQIEGEYWQCYNNAQLLTASGASSYQWQNGTDGPNYLLAGLTNSVIECVGTSIQGCSDTVQLESFVVPHPIEILGPISIEESSIEVWYHSQEHDGIQYNWTVQNGIVVEGLGTDSILVNWSDLPGQGQVTLFLSHDDLFCINNSAYLDVSVSVSADELPAENILLYPNPSSNGIRMIGLDTLGDDLTILVNGLSGLEVYRQSNLTIAGEFYLPQTVFRSSGEYIISVVYNNQTQTITKKVQVYVK